MLAQAKDLLLTKLSGKKQQTNNQIDNFHIPIKKIDDLILGEDEHYKMVIRVHPINAEMMAEDEIMEVAEAVNNVLLTYTGRYQILVQRERIDIDTTIDYYSSYQKTLNDELRIELLEEQKEELLRYKDSNNKIFSFYLVLEYKEKDYVVADKVLGDYYKTIQEELSNQDMYAERLKVEEISELMYQRLNPENSLVESYQPHFTLQDIYPEYAKRFGDGRHLQIENDIYRFYSVSKWPDEVKEYRWLKRLFDYNGNLVMSFIMTPKDKDKVSNELNKGYRKARGKAKENEGKDRKEELKSNKEAESADILLENILSSNNQVFDVNLTIGIYEKSFKEIETQARHLRATVSGIGLSIAEIRNKEFLPFYNTLPILPRNKITNDYVWNLTSFDVASIVPFDSAQLMDEKGFLFAENVSSNGIITLDRYNRQYNNPHQTIIGVSGSGKTFGIGVQVIREAPFTDYIMQYDLDGSVKFPWANTIDFNPSSKIITNPFHIRTTILSDDDNLGKTDVGGYLATKIMDLVVFFKWINPNLTSYEESLLEEDIRDTYKQRQLNFDSISLPTEFPTFTTFKEVMEAKIQDKNRTQKERDTRQDMLTVFRPYIEGAYAKMFNGQTNWDYQFHNVFKLHKTPKAVQKPLYDILLKDSWEFGKKHGTLDRMEKKVYKKYIIDEEHIFADPKQPQTLEFISTELNKQGRKFGINVTNATQQANDLLVIEKHGQAILDNSNFKMLFKLGEGDHDVVQKLYGLSDDEMKLLKGSRKGKKNKGRGILIAGNQRIKFYIKPSRFELEVLDPEQYQEIYREKSRFY